MLQTSEREGQCAEEDLASRRRLWMALPEEKPRLNTCCVNLPAIIAASIV